MVWFCWSNIYQSSYMLAPRLLKGSQAYPRSWKLSEPIMGDGVWYVIASQKPTHQPVWCWLWLWLLITGKGVWHIKSHAKPTSIHYNNWDNIHKVLLLHMSRSMGRQQLNWKHYTFEWCIALIAHQQIAWNTSRTCHVLVLHLHLHLISFYLTAHLEVSVSTLAILLQFLYIVRTKSFLPLFRLTGFPLLLSMIYMNSPFIFLWTVALKLTSKYFVWSWQLSLMILRNNMIDVGLLGWTWWWSLSLSDRENTLNEQDNSVIFANGKKVSQ